VPRKLSEIENDAMELSRHDRALLAKHLLATLDPDDDADVEELWIEEAERRNAAYRSGKIGSRPAERVSEDAKRSLQ
jgi:hypothetical protein